MARFTRVLGTLLRERRAGPRRLAVVGEMLTNQVLAAAVERPGRRRQARGAGLAGPWREHAAFPPLAVHMVRVGEETGRLEEMLLQVADDVRVRRAQAASSG